MAWIYDTYSMQKGHAVPEIVTGKPISIGGSVFRHEATGAGVVTDDRSRLERARLEARASNGCVVQGFGNVGRDRGARADRARRNRAGRLGRVRRRLRPDGARRRDDGRVRAGARLARRVGTRGRGSRTRSCSSSSATSWCSPPARTRSPRPTPATSSASSSPRAPTARSTLEADAILSARDDPDPPRHPAQRRRRDGVVLRVGAGPGRPVLGTRRDPGQARREDERRLRPCLGDLVREEPDPPHLRARGRTSGTSGRHSSSAGCTREYHRPRPRRDDLRPALAAGHRVGAGGGRRADAARGARGLRRRRRRRAHRRAHTQDARREGRRSGVGSAKRHHRWPCRGADYYTIDADTPLDEAFRFLEENHAERVPVVERGRLVGVLSRSVLQRRLAEDEEPEAPTEE